MHLFSDMFIVSIRLYGHFIIASISQHLDSFTDNTLTSDSQDPGYENETKSCNCEEEINIRDLMFQMITTLKDTTTHFNQECLRLSKENMALKNKLGEKGFYSF